MEKKTNSVSQTSSLTRQLQNELGGGYINTTLVPSLCFWLQCTYYYQHEALIFNSLSFVFQPFTTEREREREREGGRGGGREGEGEGEGERECISAK